MKPFFLAALHIASAMLQVSALTIAPAPFDLAPLHLCLGIIVMQYNLWAGSIWFLITPFTFAMLGFSPTPWFISVLLAGIGPLLINRVFARRSVYALVGMGIVMFTLTFVLSALRAPLYFSDYAYGLFFVVFLLYVGSWAARRLLTFLQRSFFIKARP